MKKKLKMLEILISGIHKVEERAERKFKS